MSDRSEQSQRGRGLRFSQPQWKSAFRGVHRLSVDSSDWLVGVGGRSQAPEDQKNRLLYLTKHGSCDSNLYTHLPSSPSREDGSQACVGGLDMSERTFPGLPQL